MVICLSLSVRSNEAQPTTLPNVQYTILIQFFSIRIFSFFFLLFYAMKDQWYRECMLTTFKPYFEFVSAKAKCKSVRKLKLSIFFLFSFIFSRIALFSIHWIYMTFFLYFSVSSLHKLGSDKAKSWNEFS